MDPALAAPLERFEQAASLDPEVLGVLYTGSLGRGTADAFSDLDIEAWVPDHIFEDAPAKLEQLLAYCGARQFAYVRDTGFLTGFVGPEWRRVDVELHRTADLKPDPRYAEAQVVKDSEGVLARLVASSPRAEVTIDPTEAARAVSGAVDSQIYLALHNARGAVWSAMGEVSHQCATLYTLLARLRGRESFGFRYVEAVLSPDEHELLIRAWPQYPDRIEVRRAAWMLWDWTRFVWGEVERVLGRPLAVAVDDRELLGAVEGIYAWQQGTAGTAPAEGGATS